MLGFNHIIMLGSNQHNRHTLLLVHFIERTTSFEFVRMRSIAIAMETIIEAAETTRID